MISGWFAIIITISNSHLLQPHSIYFQTPLPHVGPCWHAVYEFHEFANSMVLCVVYLDCPTPEISGKPEKPKVSRKSEGKSRKSLYFAHALFKTRVLFSVTALKNPGGLEALGFVCMIYARSRWGVWINGWLAIREINKCGSSQRSIAIGNVSVVTFHLHVLQDPVT